MREPLAASAFGLDLHSPKRRGWPIIRAHDHSLSAAVDRLLFASSRELRTSSASRRDREQARRVLQYRIDIVGRARRTLHHRRGDVGHFSINQFLIAKCRRRREGPARADADLRTANVAVVAASHVRPRPAGVHRLRQVCGERHSIGSPGAGTTPHLSGVLFAARPASTPWQCRSAGRANDNRRCFSGDVTFAVEQSRVLHLANRIRRDGAPLAVTRRAAGRRCRTCRQWRKPALPIFVVTSWGLIDGVVPTGTPQLIVEKIRQLQGDRRQTMQKRFLARVADCSPAAGRSQSVAAGKPKMWQEGSCGCPV